MANNSQNSLGTPKKLAHTTLPDMVAREIVNYIKIHDIQCGEVLPSENDFAKYFGVGRASIREGIARLKSVGLINSVQGYGLVLNNVTLDSYFSSMIVSDLAHFVHLSKKEIEELISVRQSIEADSCRAYIEGGSPDELIPLKTAIDKMLEAEESGNDQAYRKYDKEFHRAIVALGNNRVQNYLYSIVRIPSLRELEMLLTPENLQKIDSMHKGIYNALLNKDDAVFDMLKKHFAYYFNDSQILE